MAFSLDTQTLASISDDGIIKLWDVATGVLQRSIKHEDNRIYEAAFSPDIRLLATRGLHKTAVWDLTLGIQKYELDQTSYSSQSLTFSANGLLLAGYSWDNMIVWDTITGAIRQTIKSQSAIGEVESLAISPNGRLLAASPRLSTVEIWDIITGAQKYRFKAYGSGNHVTFSPDNQFLAIGHSGGTILWDLVTESVYKENTNPASLIAYSPDGRTLASTYHNTSIALWDIDVEFPNQESCSASIEEIEFSSDGKLVICLTDEDVNVWSSSQESPQQVLNKYRQTIYGEDAIALSVDGRLLAYPFRPSYNTIDIKSVDVWDIKMGIHWSILMNDGCERIAFSPNSQQLASFVRRSISLWVYNGNFTIPSPTKSNGNTTEIFQQAEGDGCWVLQRTLKRTKIWAKVNSISFSPDGRQFALCFSTDSNCAVEIWDWTTGLLVQTLEPCLRPLTSVAFSINGQLLARERWDEGFKGIKSTRYGPVIEPWDMDTGKLHKALAGKGYRELSAASPVEDIEFLSLQNRYVKCKDITIFEEQWVCFQGRKILWLPPQYRATCSAANNTTRTLALGYKSRGVIFIKFSLSTEFIL